MTSKEDQTALGHLVVTLLTVVLYMGLIVSAGFFWNLGWSMAK